MQRPHQNTETSKNNIQSCLHYKVQVSWCAFISSVNRRHDDSHQQSHLLNNVRWLTYVCIYSILWLLVLVSHQGPDDLSTGCNTVKARAGLFLTRASGHRIQTDPSCVRDRLCSPGHNTVTALAVCPCLA